MDQRRKSKEAQSRTSEGQYQSIFERYPQAAWVLDRATLRILAATEAAITEFGYSRDEFLAMSYLDLHLPEEAIDVRRKLVQDSSSRGTSHWRLRTRDGTVLEVEAAWRPVPFERVPAILMTAGSTHLGLRRLLQETEEGRERLENLSRRLVELQESERAGIARELHDEIGQLLTGLKLMLHADHRGVAPVKDAAEPQPPSRRMEMTKIVNEMIGRVRDLSMNLRPPMLDEIGLVPTLLWHFERYTARNHVSVSFGHPESVNRRFPAAVEIAAFRIIQEALTNAARHAGVETVEVEVNADQKHLWLRIEDSGLGFDRKMARAGRSAGLSGMQERALLLGGHLTIESGLGAGTRLTVALPLREARDVESSL